MRGLISSAVCWPAGRVVMTPEVAAEGRFYAFEGKLSFGALVTGLIGTGDGRVVTVVPPG